MRTRLKTAAEAALIPNRKRSSISANWYDASRWSPSRMWVFQPVQSAKRDLDKYTRFELNKRGEYLWKNSPLIRGLIERLVTLTIGTGIHPTPKSSDPKWNDAAKKFWKRISRRPCVDSKMTMHQYQRIKARGRFKHGESFTVLTHSDRYNCDAIQGLEWHRVSGASRSAPGIDNYTGTQGNDSPSGDGIDFDAQGFPIRYHLDGFDPVSKEPLDPIDERFMVHHFTPVRDEQVRGETILSSAINTAQDMKEILEFEKQAVKDASSHLDIIQTMTGDLDPETFRKTPFGVQWPTTQNLPSDSQTRDAYYKVAFGNQPIVLKTGDKYTPYISSRPGSAWAGFMAFLSNTIILGTGMPPSLVLPIDIGGTDIRRDLKIGQKVVAAWQKDIAHEFQTIWEYFIQGGIEDRELPPPPEDWQEVDWHFTESLTVDRQQAQVDRDDVESGLMSWDHYHGRSGRDGADEEAKMIKEVRRRRFQIAGIPEDKPFESANEFKQYLSMSQKSAITFRDESQSPDDDAGAGGQNAAGKNKPKLATQKQPEKV